MTTIAGGVQTRFQSRHPQALQYFTEGNSKYTFIFQSD